MPLPGYLQDLSELLDDHLLFLPPNGEDPPLVDSLLSLNVTRSLPSSAGDSQSNYLSHFHSPLLYELSTDTLSAMLLLNDFNIPGLQTSQPQFRPQSTASEHSSVGSATFTLDRLEESYKPIFAPVSNIISPLLPDSGLGFNMENQDLMSMTSPSKVSSQLRCISAMELDKLPEQRLLTESESEMELDISNKSQTLSTSYLQFVAKNPTGGENLCRVASAASVSNESKSPDLWKKDHSIASEYLDLRNSALKTQAGYRDHQLHLAETSQLSPAPMSNLVMFSHVDERATQSSLDQAHMTSLSPRTTETVIAELKRPSNHPSTVLGKPWPMNVEKSEPVVKLDKLSFNEQGMEQSDYNLYDDEEDSASEDPAMVPKQRKITERNRQLNSLADRLMQELNQQSVKQGIETMTQEEAAQQSTRWLVHQSESHQIISSPREYQLELFERAKEKNIIAVLDTGSGKTLIAVLLLRHIFAQELEDRAIGKQHRISFFLVDSVQLVFQQHAVLKANLDQSMDMFCGDMGCDLWSEKSWAKHFAENTVIVCTAEVLRQCLHHSFISMESINLLIFDEAHHAKKDHPYARIIKDFYIPQVGHGLLPKIFGMTASPVDARVDVRKAAEELEAILHCEIATAADLSLLQYTIQSKQEIFSTYDPLGPAFETPLFKQMNERFKANRLLMKPLAFSREATRELGSWCSDQVWLFCLTEDETKKLQSKTERRYHAKKVPEPLSVLEQLKVQLQDARDTVRGYAFDAPDIRFDGKKWSSQHISSKVGVLITILKERFQRPTDDKCIIFVRQRYTARLLAKLLSHPQVGTPFLHVGTLVGTRTGDAGDLNVSFREQVVTMMNFRKGKLNCLFATSVAEEGLDVPDCNLVIRFDLYTTLIQYIQSRGRARHANSRYIHMAEKGNQEHYNIIREVRRNESKLKEFCAALPEDRKLTGNDFDMDQILAKERTHRVWKHPETGAKLTYKMSLMVLSNFIDSLPRSQESNLQAEYVITVQNKRFICEAILPEQSPLRGAVGRPASTKQVAKCSAAFETCLDLVKGKYLDKHLLPIFTKQLPAMRNAALAVDSKKREAYDMKIKPQLWSVQGSPNILFLTVLTLGTPDSIGHPSQPLALLTRSRLPDLPSFLLHFGKGRQSPVICTTLSKAMDVTQEVIDQINTFTRCIFDDVFSKLYESDPSKMPYFLVPIKIGSKIDSTVAPFEIIDWDILQSIEQYQLKWGEKLWENDAWRTELDSFFENRYIVDPYDGSRKLWCRGVTQQYKPLDPVPQNSAPRSGPRKNNDNIMEYSCSLWAKARAKRTFDPDQRVMKAEYISLRRNLLDEFAAAEAEAPKECFIILQPLKISPLPTAVVSMAYVFPAIVHRVESYLIALEAAELLHLEIRPDLALEALTKDSDNSEEHDEEKINFQRGMGNNYERLEFLGDCFLKMATSISLYGLHPDNDEYRYHVDRMLLICNKNLKNNAIKLKLYEYIRSQSFGRRAWYPQGLVLKRGKAATAPSTHKLGDKSIADVCEAFIGAALLTCHETKDMDNAVRAVTEVVCSENHNVVRYSDYYTLYEKPNYQLASATASQLDLAQKVEAEHPYHFNYPRLARSAFTHPSYPFSYEKVPSYQRLEFLGDALLDMACVNFLYHNYPGKDPQWLTEHKMAMASNQFLGALCVALGFQTHLLIFNAGFQKQISDYVSDVTEARRAVEEDALRIGKSAKECAKDYWVHVRQPPKCLPDVVEAYIGAIFVDSEYDYSQVERFFDMHIRWYFEDMSIYDTFANKHPTTFLTKFLQTNMGCMDWSIMTREQPSVDGSKPLVVAMVIIHGQLLANAQAESSRYAKVNAAKQAVQLLDGLPLPEFREKYRCKCHLEEEKDVSEIGADIHDYHGTAV